MLLKNKDNILRDKMLGGPLLPLMVIWSTSLPICIYLTSHSDRVYRKVWAGKCSCNSAAESKESHHHKTSQLSVSHQILHRTPKMNDCELFFIPLHHLAFLLMSITLIFQNNTHSDIEQSNFWIRFPPERSNLPRLPPLLTVICNDSLY